MSTWTIGKPSCGIASGKIIAHPAILPFTPDSGATSVVITLDVSTLPSKVTVSNANQAAVENPATVIGGQVPAGGGTVTVKFLKRATGKEVYLLYLSYPGDIIPVTQPDSTWTPAKPGAGNA